MSDNEDYNDSDRESEDENLVKPANKKNVKIKKVIDEEEDENDSIYSEEEEESDGEFNGNPPVMKPKITKSKIVIDDDDDEEDEDDDIDEDDEDDDNSLVDHTNENNPNKKSNVNENNFDLNEEDDEEDSDFEDDELDDKYLQKFDDTLRKTIISEHHPEMQQHNYEEVDTLCKIVRNENGIIIDPFHKTLPILTKYEKARILGERAKQLNSGAKPFIEVEPNITDGYLIAINELKQKKIPFIIKRPLPNGGSEYWKLTDLEILNY